MSRKKYMYMCLAIIVIIICYLCYGKTMIKIDTPNQTLNKYISKNIWHYKKQDPNYFLINNHNQINIYTYWNTENTYPKLVIYKMKFDKFELITNTKLVTNTELVTNTKIDKNLYFLNQKEETISQNFDLFYIENQKIKKSVSPANILYYEDHKNEIIYIIYDLEQQNLNLLLVNLKELTNNKFNY